MAATTELVRSNSYFRTHYFVCCITSEKDPKAPASNGAGKDPEAQVKVRVVGLEVRPGVVRPGVAARLSAVSTCMYLRRHAKTPHMYSVPYLTAAASNIKSIGADMKDLANVRRYCGNVNSVFTSLEQLYSGLGSDTVKSRRKPMAKPGSEART